MSIKQILLIVGAIGATIVLALGCLISLIGYSLYNMPPYILAMPNHWYILPGANYAWDDDECEVAWESGDDPRVMVCEELSEPPSLSIESPTQAAVHFEEDMKQVRFVHLTINEFVLPSKKSDDRDHYEILSWPEAIAEVINLDDCSPIYAPYHWSTVWECDTFVYAHTGFFNLLKPHESHQTHLWIGRDFADFEDSFHRQGLKELRDRIALTEPTAENAWDENRIIDADIALHDLYFLLSLIPTSERSEKERNNLEEIVEKRQKIYEEVREQREKWNLEMPLPGFQGLLHLPILLDQDFDPLEVLLHGSQNCRTSGGQKSCEYSHEYWNAEVSFTNDKSTFVIFNFPLANIPLESITLSALGLPEQPPTETSNNQIRWDDVDGVEYIKVIADDDGLLRGVEARVE